MTPQPHTGDDAVPAEGRGALSALGARGLAAALRPLGALGGIAADIRRMTGDVARMAASTDVLPEVNEALSAIRERVDRLDREVVEMHAAVEEIKHDVEGLVRAADSLPGGRRRRRARDAGQPPSPPA